MVLSCTPFISLAWLALWCSLETQSTCLPKNHLYLCTLWSAVNFLCLSFPSVSNVVLFLFSLFPPLITNCSHLLQAWTLIVPFCFSPTPAFTQWKSIFHFQKYLLLMLMSTFKMIPPPLRCSTMVLETTPEITAITNQPSVAKKQTQAWHQIGRTWATKLLPFLTVRIACENQAWLPRELPMLCSISPPSWW